MPEPGSTPHDHERNSHLRFSVIVPAHNEEAVIARCLDSLLSGLEKDTGEVLICCNGCTDRTESIVAAYAPPVRIVDVAIASKPAALNAGDRQARGDVKVFLDADVVVTGDDVMRVVDRLERGPEVVAAPRLTIDTAGSTWPVQAYYSIWTKSPYVTDGMVGSGFYALSKRGRAKFAEFPNIIGDDAYVRSHFARAERASLSDASFVVTAPKTLRALMTIETRRKAAYDEIRELLGSRLSVGSAQTGALGRLAAKPSNWPSLAVYLYVKAMSRMRYRLRKRGGTHKEWSRDETSRQVAPPGKSP